MIDSDELPTILPPKRRRLQKNGNPLMMMQNTVGGKGNSSERIMREFPRHNWLEHKINQLQQQTTCSPSEEELVAANTVHQSPTHGSDTQPSSEPAQTENPHTQDSDPIDDRHEDHPSSINVGSPVAPAAEPSTSSPEDGERKAHHPTATDGSNDKNSFSLHEALKIVGAEETEGGDLVIDEAGTEKDRSVIDTSESDHKSGKEDNTQAGVVKKSSSPELSSALESTPESQPTVDNSTLNSDTTESKPTGLPLDLCVRKNDKPGGGCTRPKAPPVQMVLPQVQQPARPVSTEPALVKETKDILQTVVTEPPESNTTSKETKTLTEEALNLTQADSQTPVSLAEMARGIVMPVGTQLQSSAVQQTTDNDQLSQQSQTLAVPPSSQVPVGQLVGPQVDNTELPSTTSPLPLSKSNSGISTVVPPLYGPPFASNSSGLEAHSMSRPTGSTIIHPASHMPGPVPGLIPAHGGQHPKPPFPRHDHPPRNMGGKDLDKEFEKHFREFKQLEILAAKKEREREELLQMKKRKAMLLREMKMLKSQQNTPHENENPSHLQGQIFKPPASNTQHRAQVAELRPFQGTPQGMAGFQKTAPGQQNTHPVYSVPAPLSHTATSPSSNLSTAPLNLVGAGHRKRGISSEDRRPIVEMINLAMLQRTRSKQRRMSEEQRTGPPGSNAVPTPAHQNKSDVIVIHDSDVPSSEITRSPYETENTYS
ncbi:endochitinase A1-like isoform X2 [Haliotis rubra]|uniref:endochitinase A1-like isoform X2 n=1 Tax=Haliotis rubra TaxID=36100 RepID=UPI001EE59F89|nr:endochitinase A1-like isoform X2 [Haliotis rubra]